MKRFIFLFLLTYFFPSILFAASDQLSASLYDSIHFAKNGNDVVIEQDTIQRALTEGANPNWINPKYKRSNSVLSHFVSLISSSEDPKVMEKGINAIKLLFEHNARLQYCDGSILFSPIAQGKYEIVKI